MSVLVRVSDDKPIATCKHLPSGKRVDVAFSLSAEAIDANREWNLINAFRCKVSNADSVAEAAIELPQAIAINGGDEEFFAG